MKGNLNSVNRNEVLKYLGYKGGETDTKVLKDLDIISNEVMRISKPAVTFRVFEIDDNFQLSGTNFIPGGNDIKEMLRECKKCILMAATLGIEIEKTLRSRQVTNMYEAVMLDSCASSSIENVCDNFQLEFEQNYLESGKYLTDRFSPGYGDMPFSQQKDICKILDTQKTIGVSLSSSGIMIPRKTVSAIIGISDKPQKKRFRGCENCAIFENCQYRKGDKHCGRTE